MLKTIRRGTSLRAAVVALVLVASRDGVAGSTGPVGAADSAAGGAGALSDPARGGGDPGFACEEPRLVFKEAEMGGDAGSRSPESVFDQFRQYRREIQGALRAGLKSRPDSGATIAIRFVVGPAGDLRSLSLTTKGLGDVAIEEPIRAVFARMRFERIESGSVTTTLRYEVACD